MRFSWRNVGILHCRISTPAVSPGLKKMIYKAWILMARAIQTRKSQGTCHLILAVTGVRHYPLCRYRRVIFECICKEEF